MKKVFATVVLSLVLVASLPVAASARNVESLYSRYAGKPGVESVSIGRFWINLAKLIVSLDDEGGRTDKDTELAINTLSHISSVRVADLSECSESVRTQFAEDVRNCSTDGYVLMTSVRDGNDNMQVLVRKDEDGVIRELLVVSSGDDPAVIQIEGRITEEEAARYISASME